MIQLAVFLVGLAAIAGLIALLGRAERSTTATADDSANAFMLGEGGDSDVGDAGGGDGAGGGGDSD